MLDILKNHVSLNRSSEVDVILEISLQDLIIKTPKITKQATSSWGTINVPSYVFEHHEVWGATAMILSEFEMLVTAQLFK